MMTSKKHIIFLGALTLSAYAAFKLAKLNQKYDKTQLIDNDTQSQNKSHMHKNSPHNNGNKEVRHWIDGGSTIDGDVDVTINCEKMKDEGETKE